ncbi:hypothetical protein [Streptomyces sp. B8F3]
MTETPERTESEDPATLSVHLRNHEPAPAANACTRRSGATGGGA